MVLVHWHSYYFSNLCADHFISRCVEHLKTSWIWKPSLLMPLPYHIQVLLLCMHEKFTVSFESFQHIHMYTAAQWESMYYNVK